MRTLVAIGLVGALAWPVAAADGKAPPGRQTYKGRKIAPTMGAAAASWLTRPERAEEENTPRLMEALGLERGDVVCDIGCGNGYFTLRLARRVGPEGKVYAVDIQQKMLALLKKRAEKAGLDNIEPVLGRPHDPKLPKRSLDLVLLVDVYHEFTHPEHMLEGIRRSLKRDGKMVLVEYRAEDPDVPIKPLHKMTAEQMLKEIPPNGYRLTRRFEELPWQHVMFFERDDILGEAKGELVADGARPVAVEDAPFPSPGDDGAAVAATSDRLYVSDASAGKTYAYAIGEDGALGDRETFASIGAAAVEVDRGGRVYLAVGRRVVVLDPKGRKLMTVERPEPLTGLTFGGPDGRTLFMKARGGLYRLSMKTRG